MNRPEDPSTAAAGFSREEWLRLKTPDADPRALRRLANRTALAFLDKYYYKDQFDDQAIRLLCEMGTFFKDEARRRAASSALFGIIVERLCNDFEEMQTDTYNRVMSLVISCCRTSAGGEALDRALNAFGLRTFQDVLERSEGVRQDVHRVYQAGLPPEKVLLLSRVTIGADVAITSVLLERLSRRFPEAEVVLIGSPKCEELFGGHPRLRVSSASYPRRGGLLERFAGWLAVREATAKGLADTPAERTLLVDPDSRLSQLGVLPLVPAERYFFFNSRAREDYAAKMSMSELANRWVDTVFGEGEFCYPAVWLARSETERAGDFAAALRGSGCGRLIAVSFGVGGNERKRIGEEFEEGLLRALLEEPGTVVLLDRGAGRGELAASRALTERLRLSGCPAREASFRTLAQVRLSEGLIAVQSRIGEFAALIARCDEYVGYDSAGQHIAAALGVPCYSVFAGANNPRFVRRWRPCGPGPSHVIHVDTLSHPQAVDPNEIVARVLDRRAEQRQTRRAGG